MRKAIFKKGTSVFAKGEKVNIREESIGKGRYTYYASFIDKPDMEFHTTRSFFEYIEDETFIVCVTRESYSTKNIEVQAKNREEAEAKAISDAGNMVFSEQGADYKVLGLFTKSQHENLFK